MCIRDRYTVTYTCTDNSGNEATATRTVFVTDSDSPSIMITGPAAITITLGTPYNDQGAVCGDNADPEPNLSIHDEVDVNNLGTYSVTYTCVDSDGNLVIATRVVIVTTPDTDAPTLTLNGPSKVSVPQNSSYNDDGATCIDDKDPDPVETNNSEDVDTSVPATYTIGYTCLLYTSPSPRDRTRSRMPSSA